MFFFPSQKWKELSQIPKYLPRIVSTWVLFFITQDDLDEMDEEQDDFSEEDEEEEDDMGSSSDGDNNKAACRGTLRPTGAARPPGQSVYCSLTSVLFITCGPVRYRYLYLLSFLR